MELYMLFFAYVWFIWIIWSKSSSEYIKTQYNMNYYVPNLNQLFLIQFLKSNSII